MTSSPLVAYPAPAEPLTPDTWPIGAALLQFPGDRPDGRCLTDGPPEAWQPCLREVAEAGFAHIDLTDCWVRPGDMSPDRLDALVSAAADHGLGFSAISITRRSVNDPNPQVAQDNLDYALRTLPAAARMGVGTLCLGLHQPITPAQQAAQWFWLARGGEDPDDPAVRAQVVDAYRRIGERAGELGVQISLELYEGTYLGTAEQAVALVQDIGLPNVGLNPDLGNLYRLHQPVDDWRDMLALMLPYTNYWHVKNYFRDEDPATGAYFSAPAPLELGGIDYRTAIGMALDAGFHGPFCTEHYGGDGLSVAARNRDYIRRMLTVKWSS